MLQNLSSSHRIENKLIYNNILWLKHESYKIIYDEDKKAIGITPVKNSNKEKYYPSDKTNEILLDYLKCIVSIYKVLGGTNLNHIKLSSILINKNYDSSRISKILLKFISKYGLFGAFEYGIDYMFFEYEDKLRYYVIRHSININKYNEPRKINFKDYITEFLYEISKSEIPSFEYRENNIIKKSTNPFQGDLKNLKYKPYKDSHIYNDYFKTLSFIGDPVEELLSIFLLSGVFDFVYNIINGNKNSINISVKNIDISLNHLLGYPQIKYNINSMIDFLHLNLITYFFDTDNNIKFCKYDKCDNFFISDNPNKKYCSESCATNSRVKKTRTSKELEAKKYIQNKYKINKIPRDKVLVKEIDYIKENIGRSVYLSKNKLKKWIKEEGN